MKTFSLYTSLILFLILSSCNQKEKVLLNDIASILPGEWVIDSMQVKPNPGIRYFGNTLTRDTVFTDVGFLSIPHFEIENLDLNAPNPQSILATLTVDGVQFDLEIPNLFLSSRAYFVYFRLGASENLFTPVGEFIDDTQLFLANHYLDVVDHNALIIRHSSDPSKGRLYMSRE